MEISDLELQDRYETVLVEYVQRAEELATYLEKFGRVRKELEALVLEVKKRNLPQIEDATTNI